MSKLANIFGHKHSLVALGFLTCFGPLIIGNAAAQENTDSTAFALEEIIVTARRRAESLQDAPISIAAITAQGITDRNIDQAHQIAASTPNLTFDLGTPISGTKSSASIFIRGIGQNDFTLNTDPGVGLYVDGVYVARSVGQALDLFDIERIEVLRGPQGTLFGRNTIGGAIAVTTTKPGPDMEGQVSATVGRFDRTNMRVWANMPISDEVFLKVGASTLNSDGYLTAPNLNKELGGDSASAGRVSLRWIPDDDLTIDATAEFSRIREESAPNILLFTNENSLFASYHNQAIAGGSCAISPSPLNNPQCYNNQFIDNGKTSSFTAFSQSDVDILGTSFTVEYNINEHIAFKSITAYRDLESEFGRDSDLSPLLITQTEDLYEQSQFSQELQLAGTVWEGKLNWLIGVYHFSEDGDHNSQVSFSTGALQSGGSVDNSSNAAFAQMTFDPNERLSITSGLRYTRETKRFTPDQFITSSSPVFVPVGVPVLPNTEAQLDFNEVTPIASVLYRLSEGLNLYTSYSRGFKSGGFSQRVFPPLPAVPEFGPETVEVIEVGFKFTGIDSRLRLNGAIFYSDYEDIQVSVLLGVAPITSNAAKAEIRGFELEMTVIPSRNLTIEAGIGYLDAEYTEIGANAAPLGLDLNDDLIKTPELSVNAGISYAIDLANGMRLTPRIDWSYRARVENISDNDLGTPVTQKSYDLVNASTRLDLNDHWTATIAVLNLTDEAYITSGFYDPAFIGFAEGTLAPPREWRFTLAKSF